MAARFPTLSSHQMPNAPRELASVMRESVANGTVSDGYVRAEAGAAEHFLFVHQGKVHSAGSLEEDRFVPKSFGEFFSSLPNASRVTFHGTDAAMLLCTAVLFRKAPTAQLPARLLNSEELLFAIRETGKDAVLVVRNKEARSLVFCKGGEPAAVYVADGESFDEAGTVADQIVEYLKKNPGCHLDLYDEIKLKPLPGAGQPIETYLATMQQRPAVSPAASPSSASSAPKEPPSLIVRLGERVVFRHPVTSDETVIGRGAEADLPLDNVSVSRRHAMVRRQGTTLLVEDLGGANGVLFKGQKVQKAELNPGDEIVIGKYTLVYPRYSAQNQGIATSAPRQASAAVATERTMMISSAKIPPAVFEYLGQKFKMGGLIFNIGKAKDAHLRIEGFLIGAVHARVMRDPTGEHTLQHVGGFRKVCVNGKAVKSAVLKDGDTITIGGATLKVTMAERVSGSGSAKLGSTKLGAR